MYNLKIKLINSNVYSPVITIDGKEVFAKKRGAQYEISYSTDSPSAHISISTHQPLRAKLWWLKEMLYFIASIFGIFDKRFDKRHRSVSYEADIDLIASEYVTLRFLHFVEGGKGVAFEGGRASESENVIFSDELARERKKKLRTAKIIFTIVTVIAIAAVSVIKIIG